ncbi:aldose 1-epimerase family protein [Sphingobacterium thalpophilum]|uniref:aldose 1-epimerase family protein n=1 Tax=Sphingobacterium thalpophilum TaxID=259 RepID=UPI0024A6C3E7|nr:aldose 1-epimerase family protein [Sphingobacterium thalpophilum]
MVEIFSEFLNVKIASQGAELRSVFSFKHQREYLWQADSKYWSRSSPILFPFVGGLRNNQYQYNGQRYRMSKHGFARDAVFSLVENSNDSALFLLSADEKMTQSYPFDFDLYVLYKILGDTLSCSYIVKNKGHQIMPFSIGAHPAFKLDFNQGVLWSDYIIEFEKDQSLNRYYLVDDLLSREKEKVPLIKNQLMLSANMFDLDAWVLKNLRSKKIRLFNNVNNYLVEMSCANFTHFGLWAAKNAPFVCLEPWFGVNDAADFTGGVEQKEGIVLLHSGYTWTNNWIVRIPNEFNLA